MTERFIVLRGTATGPVYLAPEGPFGAIRWTQDRDGAWRFTDQVDAADVQAYLVRHFDDAVAVVPDRVGPGPDRPLVHGEPVDLR